MVILKLDKINCKTKVLLKIMVSLPSDMFNSLGRDDNSKPVLPYNLASTYMTSLFFN